MSIKITDFLSVENFYFLFHTLQDIAREKYNYKFVLTDNNKNIIGNLMETIFENNYNNLTKNKANIIIIDAIEKIIQKKAKRFLQDTEKLDSFDEIKFDKPPAIDYNKPSDLIPAKFNQIIKNDITKIHKDLLIEKSDEPQKMFRNVFRKLEFKEHDLTQPPENINADLLIPQPDKFKNMFNKPSFIDNVVILVDSRDRNHDLHPEPHDYELKLDSNFRNIISIELLDAIIPNSDYLVHEDNNILHFEETQGTTLTATVDMGYYDEDTLRLALQNALNNAPNSDSTYSVTYNSSTNKYQINSDRTGGDGKFILKFKGPDKIFGPYNVTRSSYLDNSIGPVIGFNKADTQDAPFHISDNDINLTPDRSIFLYMNADSSKSFDNIEGINQNHFGKFLQISLTSDFGKYTYFINPRSEMANKSDVIKRDREKQNDYKIFFDPPISVEKLRFQFQNYNGNPFHFNGMEHSLFFRIEMFNFHYENIIMDYKFEQQDEEDLIEDDVELNNPLPY